MQQISVYTNMYLTLKKKRDYFETAVASFPLHMWHVTVTLMVEGGLDNFQELI